MVAIPSITMLSMDLVSTVKITTNVPLQATELPARLESTSLQMEIAQSVLQEKNV
jgi:hypothetical protein